jgi:AcrR family transcriptional regulator
MSYYLILLFILITFWLTLNATSIRGYLTEMPKVVPGYKEEAKQRIIQAALDVYSEKGYHEATMEDIAQKLGVTKGALYLYFKSKDELLNVIIKRWDRSIRNILPSSEAEGIVKSMESMFDHIAEDPIDRLGFSFELISEASRNPSTRKILSKAYERNLRSVTEFLRRQSSSSSAPNVLNIELQSRSLVALQFGLMASLILGIDEKDARKIWDHSTKAIIKP